MLSEQKTEQIRAEKTGRESIRSQIRRRRRLRAIKFAALSLVTSLLLYLAPDVIGGDPEKRVRERVLSSGAAASAYHHAANSITRTPEIIGAPTFVGIWDLGNDVWTVDFKANLRETTGVRYGRHSLKVDLKSHKVTWVR